VKVLMSVDMEGATGVTAPDDVLPGSPSYERFRRLLMGDVNAAIAGAFNGGATEVLVNEGHYFMRNLLIEDLDDRARLISGNHKPLMMMEGIDLEPDLVFLIGYHAHLSERGVLSHTFMPRGMTSLTFNGEPCSEGRMNATLAAAFGVAVGLVTGDEAACADARRYARDVHTVAVKQEIDRYAAICLPPARTTEMIREAATLACQDPPAHVPLRADSFAWSVEFANPSVAQRAALIPSVERVTPTKLEWISHDFPESFRTFQAVALLAGPAFEREWD
jgi:D-amino peptidase